MRRFYFDRQTDVSGTSGTGAVVEGVQLSNGQCIVRWLTFLSSICIYNSVEECVAIHGHNGSTNLVWVDDEPSVPHDDRETGRVEAVTRSLILAAILTSLTSPAIAAPIDDYQAYVQQQVTALGNLDALQTPEDFILWADAQLEWAVANPPAPCYAEAYARGIAATETVRTMGYLMMDPTASIVADAYAEQVVKVLFAEWTAAAGSVAC